MTNKACKQCGTFTPEGMYCPECGQQLYPDVGQTVWVTLKEYERFVSVFNRCRCKAPKFDVNNGEKLW